MKKVVLVLAVVLVLVGVFAVAALTQVQIDRDILAPLAGDKDANVAIRFEEGPQYGDVLEESNGVVSFDLGNALIDNHGADSFNVDAKFTIGGQTANWFVFSITNNSQLGIKVGINTSDPVSLKTSNNAGGEGSLEIGSGATGYYYFEIDTEGEDLSNFATEGLKATLEIREQ